MADEVKTTTRRAAAAKTLPDERPLPPDPTVIEPETVSETVDTHVGDEKVIVNGVEVPGPQPQPDGTNAPLYVPLAGTYVTPKA